MKKMIVEPGLIIWPTIMLLLTAGIIYVIFKVVRKYLQNGNNKHSSG